MQTWKDKLADFRIKLAKEKRCFSTKRLCDSLFQEPYGESWQQQDDATILDYVKDWKSLDDAHIAYLCKWKSLFNSKLANQWEMMLEYESQDARKMQKLIDLLESK